MLVQSWLDMKLISSWGHYSGSLDKDHAQLGLSQHPTKSKVQLDVGSWKNCLWIFFYVKDDEEEKGEKNASLDGKVKSQ